MKKSKSFFLLIFLAAFGDASAAVTQKGRASKLQLTIEDPKLKKSSSAFSSDGKQKERTELPSALLVAPSLASVTSELPTESLSQIDYTPLREMVSRGDWRGLETACEFLLMMRGDLHEGERLRLELIRAVAISKLGRQAEALTRLRFYEKYLDFALGNLRQLRDIARVKELRAHLLLVEHDIQQFSGTNR